jgi:uncharacterized membrane protein HdeD (DUF308 family)
MATPVLHLLARNWWLLLLRGIVAVLFGLLAFAWPGLTLISLILLYGAYAGADGILALAAAVRGGTVAPRWWLVLVGLLSLGAAVATFLYPGLTALVLLTFIGVWAIARGVLEIIGAIQLRKEIENEWLLVLSGLMSVVFGALVLARPGAGALALVWIIAAYAIVLGVLLIGFAFRLRGHLPATGGAAFRRQHA